MGRLSNAERLERARELKQSVEGNYEHTANIQDYELVEWLIEQAEEAEKLCALYNERGRFMTSLSLDKRELRLENIRLKEALEKMGHVQTGIYWNDIQAMKKIAKSALEETK